jgi:hypothetical protein
LRADEKHIRTQSAILYENNPKPLLLLTITVFLVRMVFIRTKNTVGARSARVYWWHATVRWDAECNSTDAGQQHLNLAAAASM